MATVKLLAKSFGDEYSAALRDYLGGGGEAALRRAYEAGRRALAEGLGVLEMMAAHEHALIDTLSTEGLDAAKLRAAMSCLAESLSPVEMALRGVREANARLQESVAKAERERRRYHALFDFAPDAYLVTAVDGTVREANAAASVLLNLPADALAESALEEFIVEEDREAFRRRLRDLRDGSIKKIEDWHLFIRPQDGRPFAASLAVAAERCSPGDASLRWLIRDVTERKRLEQQRTRSLVDDAKAQAARRLEFLAEASSILVGSFDAGANLAGVARLALPYLAEWCFVTMVEASGAIRQIEVAHTKDVHLAARLREHCLFAQRPVPEEAALEEITLEWCERAADSPEHAQLLANLVGRSAMVVPLRIRERTLGALTFVSARGGRRYSSAELALAEDLGRRCALAIENARLYRDVIAERDRAEKASRAKDEFLAILSHELRNPLMPVVGWTRMLRGHPAIANDEVLAEAVRAMERNAQTLERLVGDCLDLARISEGKIQMERKPVDLNQIVLAAIQAVRQTAESKGLLLKVEMLPVSALALGDEIRLEQVILNLLVNAVKYTEPGGEIRITGRLQEGEAEIEVTDTGAGIHPAFLEQIFQPFRRGATSRLSNQSGLGLGLSIARHIVEMHGGRIWAESRGVDAGSTFRVRLPLAALAPAETPKEHRLPQRAGETGHSRVLIIEDSADILFLLKIELEMLGHIVYTASDGERGWELAMTHRPDLIISDIKMPGLNGYDLIKKFKEAHELAAVPVIALTGLGGKADIERAIEAGFDACITKPAEPYEISALIKKLSESRATQI